MEFAEMVGERAATAEQAQIDASRALLAEHLDVLKLLHEERAKVEAAKVDAAPLQALAELLSDGKLVIYSGPLPESCTSEPNGFCLVEIALPAPAFKQANGGAGLAISEPWVGWATREAGRGRLARSWRFVSHDGEVVGQGTCGAPEDRDADLHLQRPSIAAGKKVVIAAFDIHAGEKEA